MAAVLGWDEIVGIIAEGGSESSTVEQQPGAEMEPGEKAQGKWSIWTRQLAPSFSGQYSVASDPSIVRDGDIYRMYHTGLDVKTLRTIICEATSKDGLSWEYVPTGEEYKGMVLQGRSGKYDENLESCYVIKRDDEYLMYFSGYRDKGDPPLELKGFPAALFLAKSTDGVNFKRVSDKAILKPTNGWYDNDAIYSPTVIEYNDELVMIYVGHCYTKYHKIKSPGVYLLAATSKDGVKWKKESTPVMRPGGELKWMQEGGAEPDLVKGPDGKYYLFFTGLYKEERVIGVAWGDSPFGPWEINPNPIIKPGKKGSFDEHQVLAPFVIIEGDKVRMWYLGANKKEQLATGYAESKWPLFREKKP